MVLQYPVIDNFQLGQTIAEGGFSTVFKARNALTGESAACKVVRLSHETTSEEKRSLLKEIKFHKALGKHDNILEFLQHVMIDPNSEDARVYWPAAYMVMEYADGGDLFDKIVPDVGVTDELAHAYFTQLVDGVAYIHHKGICHRDIKPENILVSSFGNLKLSDFGLADLFSYKGQQKTFNERCGSLPYVAPELADLSKPYAGPPVDCWGLGVVLFTFLAGNTPWDEPTTAAPEFAQYLSGKIWNQQPWARIRGDSASLLTGLLKVDVEKRMTVPEIVDHPWMNRSNQFSGSGRSEKLGQALAQPLMENGDFRLAEPLSDMDIDMQMEVYSEEILPPRTQFTQSLMLFSQTQSGVRHTPHLTRFYATMSPSALMPNIQSSLEDMGVRTKAPQKVEGKRFSTITMKIGGYDARKEMFKGFVEVEDFKYREIEGSFIVLRKDKGNPISWRQLWKALINSPSIQPWVLKRNV